MNLPLQRFRMTLVLGRMNSPLHDFFVSYMMENPVFGLVLSGGGVRGIAHIGVIRALEEHGIYPTFIAGASAGAIVGAFYAAGYRWDEMLQFFQDTPFFSIKNYAIKKPGLIDTDNFYHVLKKYFPDDDFQTLPKTLFISVTDIIEGRNKIFQKGPLIHVTLASAAFPIMLSPIAIGDILYADGGITNNFPVEPLLGPCDRIIGSYVNPLEKIKPESLTSGMAIMQRAFKIGMATASEQKFRHCDLLITPQPLSQYGTFSINHIDEIFRIGYQEASHALQKANQRLS